MTAYVNNVIQNSGVSGYGIVLAFFGHDNIIVAFINPLAQLILT